MSYFTYFKWSFFRIHKRRWCNNEIIRNFKVLSNKYSFVFLLIIEIVVGTYIMSVLFDVGNVKLINSISLDLSKYLRNKELIGKCFVILSFFLTFPVIYNSYRLSFLCNDKQNLTANYGLDEKKLYIIDAVCNTIYNSNELLVFGIPFIILGKKYWDGFFCQDQIQAVLFVILMLFLRVSLTCLICGGSIKLHQKKNLNVRLFIWMKNILVFLVAFYVGNVFSEWINDFPIISNKLDQNIVNKWFGDGYNLLSTMLFISGNKILSINRYILFILLFFISVAMFLLGLILASINTTKKATIESNDDEKRIRKNNYFKIANEKKRKSPLNARFYENIVFWIGIGLYAGILQDVEKTNIKVSAFVCTAFTMYFGLAIALSIFKNNLAVYCINGEGKKIIFWLEDVNKLFINKLKVWCHETIVISMIVYLTVYLLTLNKYIFPFMLFQVTYLILMFFIFNIPSIVAPYFIYSNSSEFTEFIDYKKINEAIEPIMLVVVNTVLALPVAFYMTDGLSFKFYAVLQCIFINCGMLLLSVVMAFIFKKRLNSSRYKSEIFRR